MKVHVLKMYFCHTLVSTLLSSLGNFERKASESSYPVFDIFALFHLVLGRIFFKLDTLTVKI